MKCWISDLQRSGSSTQQWLRLVASITAGFVLATLAYMVMDLTLVPLWIAALVGTILSTLLYFAMPYVCPAGTSLPTLLIKSWLYLALGLFVAPATQAYEWLVHARRIRGFGWAHFYVLPLLVGVCSMLLSWIWLLAFLVVVAWRRGQTEKRMWFSAGALLLASLLTYLM